MDKKSFLQALQAEAATYNKAISTQNGDWIVKGFIEISKLLKGAGPFTALGEDVFDDYWMFYLTEDMARAAELPKRPYTNLKSYLVYKGGVR